jgi:hypothetical protein
MSYVYPIGAGGTGTFKTIAVVGHATVAAVCMAAARAFLFQSRIYVVYDVFHGSLLLIDHLCSIQVIVELLIGYIFVRTRHVFAV